MGLGTGSSPTQTNSAQTSPMLSNQDAARSAQLSSSPTANLPAQAAGKGLAWRSPFSPTGNFEGSNGVQAPFGGIPIGDPFTQQAQQPQQTQQPNQQQGQQNIYGMPFFQNWNNTTRATPQESIGPNWMGIQLALRQPRYTAQNPYSVTNLPLFNGQLGRMLYLPT